MGISRDERERAIFRSRRIYQADLESNMAAATRLGREEGIAIGKAEGRAEGEAKKQLAIAKNLLSANVPIDTIAVATGMTRAQLEALCDAD
jgi:predicted transposase/invertase (TIGR01784 family)